MKFYLVKYKTGIPMCALVVADSQREAADMVEQRLFRDYGLRVESVEEFVPTQRGVLNWHFGTADR